MTSAGEQVLNSRVELVSPHELKQCEKPLPPVPPQGLIVKTKFAGICHTDLHMWEDKFIVRGGAVIGTAQTFDDFKFPLVLGHEIAGEVYALGDEDCPDAPSLSIGDRVVVYPWYSYCFPPCKSCRVGSESTCITKPIAPSFGLHTDGGFEAYVVVKYRSAAVVVPPSIGLDVAALVPCSGITAYNALMNALPSVKQSFHHKDSCTVLICGLGGVGMWGVGLAKALLPPETKIYALDVVESKLRWASSEGITGVIQVSPGAPEDDVVAKIIEVTGGVDAAIDFVGTDATTRQLVGSLNRSGILVVVGIAGGILPLTILEFVFKDQIVRGSQVGNKNQIADVFELIAQKKIRPPPIDYCNLSVEEILNVFNKFFSL